MSFNEGNELKAYFKANVSAVTENECSMDGEFAFFNGEEIKCDHWRSVETNRDITNFISREGVNVLLIKVTK